MSVDEFDYLCRLCAAKTGILLGLPIFDPNERIRNYDKKIAACLPVQVSINDELPKVVCEECAFKLDEMFDFREKCLQTENLFMEMLKGIKSETEIDHSLQSAVDEIDRISDIESDIVHNGVVIDSMENSEDVNNQEATDRMQVMDEMDLAGGEQVVVSQEEIEPEESGIEVTTIDCLDSDTVRMVDQHIRDVSGHQIAMLEGNMAVVDHLGINYVTAIDSETQTQEQIVHYCDKYEPVEVKDGYQRLQQRLAEVSARNVTITLNSSESQVDRNDIDKPHAIIESAEPSGDIPSTSQVILKASALVTEYTKHKKNGMLESMLNNPTADDTGTHWYLCPLCDEVGTDPNSLASHFEQHFCSCSCGLHFTSPDALSSHKQKSCSKSRKIKREPNDKVEKADTKPVVSAELPVAATEDTKKQTNLRQKWTPKICSQCGKQYRTNYKLQEHMRKHTGEKPFQCLLCDKAFRSKIGLAQHTATHTGQFDYSCSTCGKGFQCKSYLIVHQRVHSDLKPYPCSTCGQNFKTKQSLLDHQNRHLGVKPYMCEICGRGFITKGLCKSHQKIHSGTDNRQYPCEVCNKMFVSKSYLNTHLRIHTGEKPYLCEVCGKGFLTRVDLKIHSTMHTGEKSFKCEICNKVFARRAALRCHRRSHTGERPYRCDICGKTFTQFSPMAIHKRLHTGERPYECDVCGKTFVSRSTMMCHRKKHHLPAPSAEKEPAQEHSAVAIRETQEMIAIND